MVPHPNCICFDCQYPTAQSRSTAAYAMRHNLALAAESLRDRFAMAALSSTLSILNYEFGTNGIPNQYASLQGLTHKAYEIADAMLIAREPSPTTKETDDSSASTSPTASSGADSHD